MCLQKIHIQLRGFYKNVSRLHFCRYSNQEVNCKMKVLNVAEKNDAAKNIAGHLSGGNLQRVTTFYLYLI